MLHELRKATCGLKKLHFTLTRRSIDLALKTLFSDNYNVHKAQIICKDFCHQKIIFFQKM